MAEKTPTPPPDPGNAAFDPGAPLSASAQSQVRKMRLSPATLVEKAGLALGKRDLLALGNLSVRTVADLLKLEAGKTMAVRAGSVKTCNRVAKAQETARQRLAEERPASFGDADTSSWDSADEPMLAFDDLAADLSSRARGALRVLGVDSAAKLARVTEGQVLSVRTAGRATWREIALFRGRFPECGFLDSTHAAEQFWAMPCTEGRLFSFPLFSGLMPSEFSAKKIDDSYSPDAPIQELGLGTRARNVLRARRVAILRNLLALQSEKLLGAGGCGPGPLLEIQQKAQHFVLEANRHAQVSVPGLAEGFWAKPVTERGLSLFPLFSDLTIPEFSAADIDDSYQPDASIQELLLPIRARRVLSSLNVSDFRSLLALEPATLLSFKNCGTDTVREIQREVKQFILGACGLAETTSIPPEAFGEFGRMADSFFLYATQDQRKVAILRGRLGLPGGTVRTLESLAKDLHLSRERVRQMENECVSAITTPRSLALLAPFWRAVQATLEPAGGVLELAGLAERLTRYYGWPNVLELRSLGAFISLNPAFSIDNPGLVALVGAPCTDCETATTLVTQLAGNTREIALSEAIPILCEGCRRLCKKDVAEPGAWSAVYIKHLLDRQGRTDGLVRVEGDKLYAAERWELRFGTLRVAVRRILLDQGIPLHSKKVCAILRPWRDRVLSEHVVDSSLGRTEGIWFWGRGTYIHRGCVSIPETLIRSIEAWMQRRLADGLPCLSVNGAFSHFRSECAGAGIPTAEALYTCLRRIGHPALLYPRLPYVYSPQRSAGHVPLHVTIEKWLEEAAEPVSQPRLKALVCDKMGFKAFQFKELLPRLQNTVRTESGELVHRSALGIRKR